MFDFVSYLFDTSGFPPRWKCGAWTSGQGWLHILSDLGVWSAYFAIPCVLGYYLLRRKDVPFRKIFLLFAAFILLCGATHLMDALIFWWPAYRLAGVIKLFTALVSWITVIALVSATPRAMRMRSPEELQREIEERMRVEDSLRKEQGRFTTIAAIAPGAICTYLLRKDGSVCFPYASPGFTQIYGLKPEEVAEDGSAVMVRIHPDDVAHIQETIANSALTMSPWHDEFRWLHPYKGEIWIEGRTTPTREPDGSVLWHGFITDITERKQAEVARNLLASIVESAQDAIVSKTRDGTITSWNTGAERLLGYSAQEIIGKSNSLIVPPDRLEAEVGLLEQIALGKSIEHYETVRLHKSGRRVEVVLSLSPVRDSGGTVIGFAKIMHDITARKLLEKEVLEIATAEQRRIGQELHDTTGQELTALNLLAETLVETVDRQMPAKVMIAAKIVEGLQRTLGQIRAVARGLIPVEVDASGLQASLEELASRTSELDGVTCTVHCGSEPVEVNDNQTATQLFHIAQEAVTNGLRHGKASHIILSLLEDDRTVTLRIQDDGVGFLTGLVEGEGVGLRIMHYRVRLINGRLAVVPREPVGTTVTCTIFKGGFHEQ